MQSVLYSQMNIYQEEIYYLIGPGRKMTLLFPNGLRLMNSLIQTQSTIFTFKSLVWLLSRDLDLFQTRALRLFVFEVKRHICKETWQLYQYKFACTFIGKRTRTPYHLYYQQTRRYNEYIILIYVTFIENNFILITKSIRDG